jgi:protein ImuB
VFASIHARPPAVAPPRDELLKCARRFSPSVEATDGRTVVFKVGGLTLLYESAQALAHEIASSARGAGIEANVALASNADAAVLAAGNFEGVTLVPERAAAALARLRIESLSSPPPELSETLGLWGVRTLGELRSLPAEGVAARLGQRAVRLRRLAGGESSRPLAVERPSASYERRVELEEPTSLLQPVLFILSGALQELCARLQSDGEAAGGLALELGLEGGAKHERLLTLPFPIWRPKSLLRLLQADLEGHCPQSAVVSVTLRIEAATPRRTQGGLYVPERPEPEKLEVTLARIRLLVGEENIGVPELLDTHHPEPFRLAPFTQPPRAKPEGAPHTCQIAFRFYRPPLAARVGTDGARPLVVRAGDLRGKVLVASGPWRSSGDWWSEQQWARDEWDVALSSGGVYRLVNDGEAGWFVEGCYD